MGLFNRWFKKPPPEDYEEALAELAKDISRRQTRLSEIRLRERRATLLVSVYALSGWIAYTSLWYMDFLPNFTSQGRRSGGEMAAKAAPVFIGPIIILFVRRIVQLWYARIGDAEEQILVRRRTQQREKIEEVKKKTNYYSMRNLIERYDEGESPRARPPPAQAPMVVKSPMAVPMQPQTPQRNLAVDPKTPSQGSLTPGLQQQLSPSPQRPLPPPRKQWYDRVADMILGDEDTSQGAATRYALICQKCFAHNGLVKESMWEDAQYVCPKCGYFNPSARTLRDMREGKLSHTPAPPSSAGVGPGNFVPPVHAAPRKSVSPPRPAPDQDEDTSTMDVDS